MLLLTLSLFGSMVVQDAPPSLVYSRRMDHYWLMLTVVKYLQIILTHGMLELMCFILNNLQVLVSLLQPMRKHSITMITPSLLILLRH